MALRELMPIELKPLGIWTSSFEEIGSIFQLPRIVGVEEIVMALMRLC